MSGTLQKILGSIGTDYIAAKNESIANHPFVRNFENDSVEKLNRLIGLAKNNTLFVKASLGQGNWAVVPWIAFIDKTVTDTTTKGYYPVYLFSSNCEWVYLTMGQGVTIVKDEFPKDWKQILGLRADIIRSRIPEYKAHFVSERVFLGATRGLAKEYEETPAFSKKYNLSKLPSEETLESDLKEMLSLYRTLILRGGTDLVESDFSENERGRELSLSEKKQYSYHRRIEGRANTNMVKELLGYKCQVCDFDFQKTYGVLGSGYIEAHHMVPYSELEHGAERELNPEEDFAVLCANCHRMIHRMDSPNDLDGLREVIKNAN